MTFTDDAGKTFYSDEEIEEMDNQDIQYTLSVKINDDEVITITAPTEEMLLEQLNKVDRAKDLWFQDNLFRKDNDD